jgi:hypothetical protein
MEAIACVLFILRLRRLSPKKRGVVRVVFKTLPAAVFTPLLAFGGVGGLLTPMPVACDAAPAIPGQASTSVADLTAPAGSEPVD